MILFSKINPFVFFVSLFVGLLITYVTTPTPDIVYQYPTLKIYLKRILTMPTYVFNIKKKIMTQKIKIKLQNIQFNLKKKPNKIIYLKIINIIYY